MMENRYYDPFVVESMERANQQFQLVILVASAIGGPSPPRRPCD